MRRLFIHSPKLGRPVTLFSHASLDLWAMLESHAEVSDYCEHPGYVHVNDKRVFANFWLERNGHAEVLLLDSEKSLEPENTKRTPTLTGIPIRHVAGKELQAHRMWISNWLSINLYIVSNARYVSQALLDRTLHTLSTRSTLESVEYALRDVERMLVRSAVFMLLHQGKVQSDQLRTHPLGVRTRFSTVAGPS